MARRKKKRRKRKKRQTNPAQEFNRMMVRMTKVAVVSSMGLATMSVARSIGK